MARALPTVELTPEAAEDLDDLNEPILTRVANLLQKLKKWPNVSGVKPLTGPLLIVEKIGHRDGFYDP